MTFRNLPPFFGSNVISDGQTNVLWIRQFLVSLRAHHLIAAFEVLYEMRGAGVYK